ncbi:EutN/CcmL family microcompartment protein [Geosporobacter ferrireducens]|uniref:Ethanolamine utilization protein EutN n=1 Tax=Geosporobacter ferrireducens TaxID=1424294 RepID=A0A1D8GKA7_9FIRM|nr:EutN/CcmL family microcompartment protein [Geosporobacter ferrireducens]AOT71339.1 ethanolamine utilization protein EutN [Geosporobacter ferrireducens]MTI57651.1 ethanolamine utilization protein EutN [Geosporobacter ferrireducens]
MYLAKIVGNVIATRKDEALVGSKILIVQPINGKYEEIGNTEVAIDSVGAGVGEIVIVSKGSSARIVSGKENSPVDAAIIGIVDSMEVNG